MKRKWIGGLIGGILGFIVPWFYLAYLVYSCKGSHCSGIGIATIPIFIMSNILFFVVGLIVFFIIGKKEAKHYYILSFIIMILFSFSAFAYSYQEINMTQNDSDPDQFNNDTNYSTQFLEELGKREFIFDAPYATTTSKPSFPVLFLIRDSDNNDYSFHSIKIYDENNNCGPEDCNLVRIFSYAELGLPTAGNCGGTYGTISAHTWHSIQNLSSNLFILNNNAINLSVKFDGVGFPCGLDGDSTADNQGSFTIRVINTPTIFPKISDWYCGDTHYHSEYTDTTFPCPFPNCQGEFGGPLDYTTQITRHLNMDWVTATDHSNSFNSPASDDLDWSDFVQDCSNYIECLIGEEVNSDPEVLGSIPLCESLPGNHILTYNIQNGYFDNGCFGISSPAEILQSSINQGGFAYIAHPESEDDALNGIDAIITTFSQYSLNNYIGLEIWNGDLKDSEHGQERIADLEAGLTQWKNLLLQDRKVFISAGSDAHGDFNTAFGREMTCVYSPSYSKPNIFNGLKNGNSFMTNNGALIFSINNAKLGETTTTVPNSQITLNIQYNVLNSCTLKVYKGIIGGAETQIGSSQTLSGSGSLVRSDTVNSNSYYRLECKSSDGKSRIYTNPIWVDVTQQPICVVPTSNIVITQNTVLCPGEYNLPTGIRITNSNVLLDCNGAKLIGNTSGTSFVSFDSYGVWAQQPNITIQNCEIKNYSYGLNSASNNLISNKLINNTLFWNFRGLSALNKHEISNNLVRNNAGVGIEVFVSGSTTSVTGNLIFNNSIGIFFSDSGNGPISNVNWNEIYGNPTWNLANGHNNLNAVNNWWGTNNAAEIADKILDSNDQPNTGTVYFIPFIERISCTLNLVNTSWSDWQNISCLPNDKMNQSRFRVQYDANNCGTITNQTFVEYRANQTCNYCSPNPINTTWTNWQNQTSCLNNIQIQNRSRTEYDANYSTCYAITQLPSDLFVNITYWEFRNQSCDYCVPNLTNTSWSNWTNFGLCTTQDIQNQSRYRIQYDTNNCNEIQNQTFYEYNITSCNETQEFMNVNKPSQEIFSYKKILFNITLSEQVDRITYIDNSISNPTEKTLCNHNCFGYGNDRIRKINFADGNHNLTIKAIKNNQILAMKNIQFFVDSKIPQISKTEPRNGFVSGNFLVEFKEINPSLLKLKYGNSQSDMRERTVNLSAECQTIFGGKTRCESSVQLNDFDDEEISYWFSLTDVANSSEASTPRRLDVDTTFPVINSISYVMVSPTRARIILSATENNFDEATYLNHNDNVPREKVFCSRLTNSACSKTITLRPGVNSIDISVFDKAGNSIAQNLQIPP